MANNTNTKKVNTRIQNKHDIEANWKLATNFIPLAGELIIYDKDDNHDYERFKIGDGITPVNDLPFAWADKSNVEHTHTVSHTPAGSVSQPTFTGEESKHTHSFSGSVSHDHSFTGTAETHNHTFTGTGTLIKADFAGTEQTASVRYTPAGTVSTPTITVTPNTTTVNSITAVGTLPSLTYNEGKASHITAWNTGGLTGSVSNSGLPNRTVTLTFTAPSLTYSEVDADNITKWSAGTLPTKGSATTVVTGIKSASSTQPTFSGTVATISHKHTPSGTVTITTGAPGSGETANYTPAGAISDKSLTPTGTIGSTSISISGTTSETTLTPAGTVSKPTFSGTTATLTTSTANS